MAVDPRTGQTVVEATPGSVNPQAQALLSQGPGRNVGTGIGRLAQAWALQDNDKKAKNLRAGKLAEAGTIFSNDKDADRVNKSAQLLINSGDETLQAMGFKMIVDEQNRVASIETETILTGSQFENDLGPSAEDVRYKVKRKGGVITGYVEADGQSADVMGRRKGAVKGAELKAARADALIDPDKIAARKTAEKDEERKVALETRNVNADIRLGKEEQRKVKEEARKVKAEERQQRDDIKSRRGDLQTQQEGFNKSFNMADTLETAQKLVNEEIEQAIAFIEQDTVNLMGPEGLFNSGFGAEFLSDVGGTDSKILQTHITAIISTVGIERLLDVKRSGGTFGALSEKELNLLAGSLGSLERGQGGKKLIASLRKVQRRFKDVVGRATRNHKELFGQGDPTKIAPGGVEQKIWDVMSLDEKAVFFVDK